MIVYVKAEIKKADTIIHYSCSLKALSSLHGLKKFESYVVHVLGIWPDSMESSTRQPYTSLSRCYPLVTINHKHVMQGLLCIETYNKETYKLIDSSLSCIDYTYGKATISTSCKDNIKAIAQAIPCTPYTIGHMLCYALYHTPQQGNMYKALYREGYYTSLYIQALYGKACYTQALHGKALSVKSFLEKPFLKKKIFNNKKKIDGIKKPYYKGNCQQGKPTITNNKGKNMETKGLKQIGKGAFSTVYKQANNKVLIKSCDNAKECMSMHWFPKSRLFPKIERVGVSDCGKFQFYTEKYYEKATSLKNSLLPNEYAFYKLLQKYPCGGDYSQLIAFFKSLPVQYRTKKKALLEAIDTFSNYGSDIRFEISPRNVTVNNGKLVLLDCFFFANTLTKVRNAKKRNVFQWQKKPVDSPFLVYYIRDCQQGNNQPTIKQGGKNE